MALDWSVDYYYQPGATIATLSRAHGPWATLPPVGVVRVHIRHGEYRHTLQGMDNYWIDEVGSLFGMFNDPENADWYEGLQAVAWAWPRPDLCVQVANPRPPRHARVLAGVMLPDTLAHEIGLI